MRKCALFFCKRQKKLPKAERKAVYSRNVVQQHVTIPIYFVIDLPIFRTSVMNIPMSDFLTAFPLFPVLLSLKIAGAATVTALITGLAAARFQAGRRSPASRIMDALCTLPMVLPPTVLGWALVMLLGRRGLLGPWLSSLGIELMFSPRGAVVAASVAVFPLVYKSSRAALELVDPGFEQTARTLGASEAKIFFLISLPLAWRGILSGTVLAFARGMGEFGATLMIAGNIPGRTQTLSLAVYDAFQSGNDAELLALAMLSCVLCLVVLTVADALLAGGGRR